MSSSTSIKTGNCSDPSLASKGSQCCQCPLLSSWCQSPGSCSPSATGISSFTKTCGSSGWFLAASLETHPVSVVLSGASLMVVMGWDSGSVCLCLSPVLVQNAVPHFPGEFMPLWVVLRKCHSFNLPGMRAALPFAWWRRALAHSYASSQAQGVFSIPWITLGDAWPKTASLHFMLKLDQKYVMCVRQRVIKFVFK